MKATDLRIGNLIGLNDSEWDGFNQFFELMDSSEVKIFLEDKNKHAYVVSIANEIELAAYGVDLDYYNLSEIETIPLTEEWLIRFRFKKFDNVFELRFKGFCLSVYLHDNGNIVECYIENVGVEIFYVHQLQNLYHALTGEELTLTNNHD